MFHRGMIAAVALPHTGQRLRRWSEHLDGVWDGDAKRCFSVDGASEMAGNAPKNYNTFKVYLLIVAPYALNDWESIRSKDSYFAPTPSNIYFEVCIC